MLEITDSFQESLVVAIILAFVIVLIVLRDVRLSLITILPVIAITLWLRGGMVLSDTPVNLVTVQISSLAIGLGVDYAIHMVQRVREARFDNPTASQEDWMEESLDETGNNVATCLGFLQTFHLLAFLMVEHTPHSISDFQVLSILWQDEKFQRPPPCHKAEE